MDVLGLGKFASTAILGAIGTAALAGAVWWIVDSIGDARESKLRTQAVEDRLKGIRDANEREKLLKKLPIWAKARCAAEGAGTECCGDAGLRVPRCIAPIAGDE